MRFMPLIWVTVFLVAAGCASNPDRAWPAGSIDVPDVWREASATDVATNLAWWTRMEDPNLTRWVEEAVHANHDLRIARARLREARAGVAASAAGFYPSVGVGAGMARQRVPAVSSPSGSVMEDTRYVAGFDAAWEVDVFGGTRAEKGAASARAERAVAELDAVRHSIAAETAAAYLAVRGWWRRLELAETNLALLSATRERIEALHAVGLAPALDVARARSQQEAAASVPPVMRAAAAAETYRLGVLTGLTPHDVAERLLATPPWVIPEEPIPAGLPSELLDRRPDLRAAEKALVASGFDRDAAEALRFPRFYLTGRYGREGLSAGDLSDSAQAAWSIGPSLVWPVFQGGRIRAGIEAADARQEAALARYEQAVLIALADVESALSGYAAHQAARRSLRQAAEASRRTAELARRSYDQGLIDFFEVLAAEREQAIRDDQLAEAETAVAIRFVQTYKALGGGPGEPDPGLQK